MKKTKVAVVDDHDEIRSGFAFLINASEELQCIGSYGKAEDLLQNLNKIKPDVVILDIGLPGISGIECCREIKQKHSDVQLIICTIYEDDERLFSALAAGASGYILKRSSTSSLVEAIHELKGGGAPMSPLIARRVVESFRATTEKPGQFSISRDFNLSKREIQILELLASGCRNKEIAERLYISNHTVRSHIYHIYEKLHVKSRVEALNKVAGKR